MVDFIRMRTFKHRDVDTKPRTSKSKKTNETVLFSSYCFAQPEYEEGCEDPNHVKRLKTMNTSYMFAGFSNGKIVFYRKKHQDSKSMLESGRDHEIITLDQQNSHKGDVRKLIFTRIEGLEVLISGSADSTIKLWEPMNQKTQGRCFQTIIGHAGTILDMIYLEKVQLLVTSSTDNSMRIWRVDKARNLLLYPWFVEFQKITEFSSVKSQSALEASVWVQCFDKKQSDSLQVYGGDSEGSIYVFEASDIWHEDKDTVFHFQSKQDHLHKNGIIQVLLVQSENLIFTISFDQELKWFEATERAQQVAMKNPNKCVYTSICWDKQEQELYAADEKGYIYIINVYQEDKVITKEIYGQQKSKNEHTQKLHSSHKTRIKRLEIVDYPQRCLLVHTDFFVESFRIKKGIKTQDMEGHQAPILKIIVLEPSKMERITKEKILDDPKVVTCALDNTIMLWDYTKMEVISKMQAPQHSEITCMTFLYNCCLVATGHEDGSCRLWNLEINTSVLLKCNEEQKHTNTISCIKGIIWKDSEILLCGSYDGHISNWEISEKKSGNAGAVNSTIFPQLRQFIDNTYPRVPRGFDNKDCSEEILVLDFYEKREGEEGYIIVGGNNFQIQVYAIRTNILVTQMEGHTDSVTCMVSDGNILITGSDDKTIRLWELNMFQPTHVLGEHAGPITDLLFLSSGLLLSCGQDNQVIAWEYSNQQIYEKFTKKEELRCMDYVQESGTLLLGTNNNSIVTHNIVDLLNYFRTDFKEMDLGDMEGMSYGEEEEEKWDPMEGEDIDSAFQRLVAQQQNILQKDKAGQAEELQM